MNPFRHFAPWLLAFLFSCQQPPSPPPPFLPGMYVTEAANEFCRITDTLIIQKMSLGGSVYEVTRRSAFQRILPGEKRPVEYQSQQWETLYDSTRQVLLPAAKEAEISYSTETNKIRKGEWEYEKVE
jgi:hypothetical protein